ncbi:MAG: GTPase ObgE [Rhodothermales bacterium]
MKFVDYVTISVRSGKGGAGAVSFRRAKYEPNGGPDGGDGGAGGSVLLEGDAHLYTLLDLRYNRHHFADNGRPGSGAMKQGRSGDDIVLRVPIGTIARNAETDEIMAEIIEPGQRIVLAQGGRGGKGNTFFKSSTHQTPRYAQPGEPGQEMDVVMELKLLADVGLVGFPNAGKSTLVASLSAARPKIADYPFTTLEPALGVVRVEDYKSFVIADIPGIIEGAHEGRGLGVQFLKHIERNAILLFVIPSTDDDPAASYRILLAELEAFNPDLLRKPRMVALSKIDLLPVDDLDEWIAMIREGFPDDLHIVPISAVAQKGLDRLRMDLWNRLEKSKA